MSEAVVQPFQAEVAAVLRLVVNSLYSHKEIFLRELVSNASDALDKLRFRSLSEPDLLAEGEQLRVRLRPDAALGTLTIEDNGVGMTEAELIKNLGTIAWSGSREFMEKLEHAQKSAGGVGLIGQFGVGFYSAYLVADQVTVTSRAAGADGAFCWRSEGKESFAVTPAERAERGTAVTLHLKPDQREFLDEHRLRSLVQKYSDYINYPIEIAIEREVEEGGVKRKREEFEAVNRASALWQRSPKDIEPAQYDEFYKHLTHDWETPLAHRHFRIEGTQMFVGLLFVPRHKPFDLFDAEVKHGVRLHVKRVLIMDNCEELVPRWLRFMRGIVDSEDLPLNVSREILQDSRAVKIIKKQVVSQALELFEQMASERKDDYATFWANFGTVLKEGVYFEAELKERIAALLRFESSSAEGLSSLDEYVARMPEGQPAIYYATGTSRKVLEQSPHLEALRARGYEVLLLTEPVDPFVVESLGEYRNKPLVSASAADLKLEQKPEAQRPEAQAEQTALVQHFKAVLGERVRDVRASSRLTESPACLVTEEGALPPHLERILRARGGELPENKRTLELNLAHPLLKSLGELVKHDESGPVKEWIELVYDQALLAEGSPIDDPVRFARRISELVTGAAEREAARLRG